MKLHSTEMHYESVLYVFAIIFVIYFASRTSSSAKYYLKHAYFCGVAIVLAIPCILYFATRPRNVLNFLTASKVLVNVPLCRLLGIKWQLRGAEHLRKDKTFVIVSNHQSSLDILGMLEIWPIMRKTTVIARRQVMYVGTFGLAAWLCGMIFIDRKSSSESKNVMKDAIEKLKEKNIKLWIFPEGTRHNTGHIHQFKKGAFHVAIQGQVCILPIVFSSYKPFLDDQKKVFESGEIMMEVLPEIATTGLKCEDVDTLMERTHSLMVEKYEQLNIEMTNKRLF